jgi:hypothetical protein
MSNKHASTYRQPQLRNAALLGRGEAQSRCRRGDGGLGGREHDNVGQARARVSCWYRALGLMSAAGGSASADTMPPSRRSTTSLLQKVCPLVTPKGVRASTCRRARASDLATACGGALRAEHDGSVEVWVEGVVAHAHGVVHDDGARVAARELQLDVPEGMREACNELVDDVGAGDTPLSGL